MTCDNNSDPAAKNDSNHKSCEVSINLFAFHVSLQTSELSVFLQNCSKFSVLKDEVEPAVPCRSTAGESQRRKMGEMPFSLSAD